MTLPDHDPRVWGPIFWKTMQIIVDAYPEHPTNEEKAEFVRHFQSYGTLLPCKECREHYLEVIANDPIQSDSQDVAKQWLKRIQAAIKAKSTAASSSPAKKRRRSIKQRKKHKHRRHHAHCNEPRRYTESGRCICTKKERRHGHSR